jgi:hypothetical protein
MTKEASNGNGQKKLWFIIPAITIVSLVAGFSASTAVTRVGVAANTAKNAEQDLCIRQNTAKNAEQDTVAARIDERLKAMQEDLKTLVERSDGR